MVVRGNTVCLVVIIALAITLADESTKKDKSAGSPAIEDMLKDPVKHHEAILEWQRNDIKKINEKLGLKSFIMESDHYILNSTMKPAVTKQIANGCEDLYAKMSKVFAVKKGDLLWAGKCVVYLFEDMEQFVKFAVQVDESAEQDARNAVGYFSNDGSLAHIAIPKTPEGAKEFEATLIHEGAHLFLQLFKKDVDIKLWIHEGVAQYFENVCFPNDPDWQWKKAMVRGGARLSLDSLRSAETVDGMDEETMHAFYAHAWSAIDFMIRANPKKFVKFIHALKDEKSEEEAIKESFGKDMKDFEQAWRACAKKSF